MDEEKLKKALEGIKKQDPQYPPDKLTATRAEYTTHVKGFKKKGCPLSVLTFLIVLLLAYLPGL